jgi:diguanylate cyclase (GGDEF)-like protein
VRIGIALRTGLLLAVIGVLASGFTGYYAYNSSRTLLVGAAEEQLMAATRVLVRQISVSIETFSRHASMAANSPQAAHSLADGDAAVRTRAENHLAALFAAILQENPEFFQMRLIDANDHGIERVRVDRDTDGLVRVTGDDLQEKGHYPYVFEALRQPPGTVYISRPAINRERGAHAGQDKPSIVFAAQVRRDGGTAPLGLVVINVDLEGVFRQLAADLPSGIDLYLTNRNGDFLLHPDPARAFAFDRGQRALVQEQFSAAAVLFDGSTDHVITTTPELVAAFVKQPLSPPQQDAFFTLGLSQPLDHVLKESNALGFTMLRIVLAFSGLSVLLAALLARAITRPLDQIVGAVKRFSAAQQREPLPLERRDEIGVLARSFAEMQERIDAQVAELHEKQDELNHLASHDNLTGLPNRRLFLDRLDLALARARRNEERLALLFIDLDRFKDINDMHGHAAGDAMLRAVAERIRASVRESDTVARLGGDEFVVLVEGTHHPEDTSLLAQKVLTALTPPVPYGTMTLEVGASIGVSQYPQDGQTASELVASADRAMYRAKKEGNRRNNIAS